MKNLQFYHYLVYIENKNINYSTYKDAVDASIGKVYSKIMNITYRISIY